MSQKTDSQGSYLLTIKHYYGLGVEAVQGPVGSRLASLVPLDVWQQREETMNWVAGVLDIFQGIPLTLPGIEVLDDRQLGPSDVLGRTHYTLQQLAIRSSCHTKR